MAVDEAADAVETITAESGDGGYLTFPVAPDTRVNVRSGPGTGYPVKKVLPYDAWVKIDCQTPGTTVSGPYGTSNIWDCIGNGLYVADAYVKTGSDGYVATHCG